MAGMGPPPSPNRRRRNSQAALLKLPAEGRQGDPPPWPLPNGCHRNTAETGRG